MENLIQPGNTKVFINYFVIILIALTSCSMSIRDTTMKKELLLEISFQDFFNGDEVGLKFDHYQVFDKLKLYSDRSIGLTKVQVKIFKDKAKTYIQYLDKEIPCELKNNNVKLTITMNGTEHMYSINRIAGIYIGFSKKNQQDLSFSQSVKPFEYD